MDMRNKDNREYRKYVVPYDTSKRTIELYEEEYNQLCIIADELDKLVINLTVSKMEIVNQKDFINSLAKSYEVLQSNHLKLLSLNEELRNALEETNNHLYAFTGLLEFSEEDNTLISRNKFLIAKIHE